MNQGIYQQIKKERGKISDDGDKMVDKYSGYFIKKIEFEQQRIV